MDDKMRKLISDATIDMYESLRKSVEQAGGAFDKDRYMKMTVDELISLLCTNNVRFVYKKPNETNNRTDEDYNILYQNYYKTAQDNYHLENKVKGLEYKIKGLQEKLKAQSCYKNPNPCFCNDSSNLFSDDPQYWIQKQKETIVKKQNKIDELQKENNNLQEKLNQFTILIKHCENIEVLQDKIEKWKISYDVINFENEHLNKHLMSLIEQSSIDKDAIAELKRSNKLMEEQLIRREQKATDNSFKPLNPSRRVKSVFDNKNGV